MDNNNNNNYTRALEAACKELQPNQQKLEETLLSYGFRGYDIVFEIDKHNRTLVCSAKFEGLTIRYDDRGKHQSPLIFIYRTKKIKLITYRDYGFAWDACQFYTRLLEYQKYGVK